MNSCLFFVGETEVSGRNDKKMRWLNSLPSAPDGLSFCVRDCLLQWPLIQWLHLKGNLYHFNLSQWYSNQRLCLHHLHTAFPFHINYISAELKPHVLNNLLMQPLPLLANGSCHDGILETQEYFRVQIPLLYIWVCHCISLPLKPPQLRMSMHKSQYKFLKEAQLLIITVFF